MSIWTDLMGHGVCEEFVDAAGVRTRVLHAGEGPLLVLLHGTGGHAETYCRNLGPLSEHFHVAALDLLGHGFSDRPPEPPSLDDYARHVIAVVDALGCERAHVSGESLGAMIAAWTAIIAPERVDRVVMNTGILARPDATGQAQLDDLERRTHALAAQELSFEKIRHRMLWLVAEPERMTDEMVCCRLEIYRRPGMLSDAAAIMSRVVGMLRGDRDQRYTEPGVMARLRRPTLVLWTRDNPGQSVELARRAAAQIPDHRFQLLEDCAHWPQFERPESFNETHLEFLTGVEVGA